MKPILFIAPYKSLGKYIKEIIVDSDDIEVCVALINEGVEIAREAEKQGVEAIISRGGTALALQKAELATPIVEIPVSPYDVLAAIHKGKKFGRNIAVLGFDNVVSGVERLGPILDVNLKVYHINNEAEAEKSMLNILDSQVDVLLGGTMATRLARKHGIPTVLIETGYDAIQSSIVQARKIVSVRRQEKNNTEKFKAILHYIKEGVIAVDQDGKVTTFNPAAEVITGVKQAHILGRKVTDLIPNSKLIEVMKEKKADLGQLQYFGNKLALTNRVPIFVEGKIQGAVATFEDITIIQKYEEKIRTKLRAKGYIAKHSFTSILGSSQAILEAKEKAVKYAKTNSTILITGESGTGKELFAQSIHNASSVSKGPFVAVNCAAIPENLLESELFGYETGAFTGASKEGKRGLFVQAHGGTLFLDEIGEVPIDLQARLLRVLQEREVRPLGSDRVIPIDVRIIAATNKNLLAAVQSGEFRSDLYYRLNILHLDLPPLRKRREDIKIICEHFLKEQSQKLSKNICLSKGALEILSDYSWPGNIRELANIMERLAVLCDLEITEEDVSFLLENKEMARFDQDCSLKEIEKNTIFHALKRAKGNKTLAAKKLGISRTKLWRYLKKYEEKPR